MTKQAAPKELGEALLARRRELGLSQRDVSKIIGVTDAAVNRYERGLVLPQQEREVWTALQAFLDMTTDDFLALMVETGFRVRERRGI